MMMMMFLNNLAGQLVNQMNNLGEYNLGLNLQA